MMYKNTFLVLFFLISFVSCDKVELRDEPPKEQVNQPVLADEYLLDSKGGLFNNVKWYAYSLENHIIWPFFDIYSIKTPHGVYFIQLINYFDQAGTAGVLKIQIKKEKEEKIHTVQVDAQGCGNPYSNPDYEGCMVDPERNAFTYLNLKSLSSKKMRDAEALNDSGWDIAFKTTSVKLNSGTSGPSSVVGALAKRFKVFFDETGNPNMTVLANTAEQGRARGAFTDFVPESNLIYYLQDGIDRVIHEKFWFKTNEDGLREAKSSVWWKVRSHKGDDILNLSIESIHEAVIEDKIETNLEFAYEALDAKREKLFLTFSTASRLENICVNFIISESFKCSPEREDWDIKLTIVNQFKNGAWIRDWRVFTKRGAKGPLSESQI